MEKLYTVKETAEKLGINEQTLRKWIRENKFIAYKIGKSYRLNESDIINFLEKRKTA